MDDNSGQLHNNQNNYTVYRVNRREVLRRAAFLGLGTSSVAGLLASCITGGGDEPPPPAVAGTEDTPTNTVQESVPEPTLVESTKAVERPTVSMDQTIIPTESQSSSAYIDSPDGMMGKDLSAGITGGILIEGAVFDVLTFNPILSADQESTDFLAFIFEPLIELHPETLEPVGRLATSWLSSQNGLTWSIKLRKDVNWHDGAAFSVEDVKFTYDTLMNLETGSSVAADLTEKIESVDIISDDTIEFNLTTINPDFLVAVGTYNIIAKHIWGDVSPEVFVADPGSTGADPFRVVGTGPFIFEQSTPGENASAVRNNNYWRGAAYLDQIIYKNVANQTEGVNQLKTGEIDLFGDVPVVLAPDLDGIDVTVVDYSTLDFTMYATNMDPNTTELFLEAAVRQALMYGLDRDAMIEENRAGYGQPAEGTIPPLSWAYEPQLVNMLYSYDPEVAMQLLDNAGWSPGVDGVREKNGVRLSFSAYTDAGNTVREQYLMSMQGYWKQIGVEMTPRLEPYDDLVERLTITHDFEVILTGFGWSATPDQSEMWTCGAYPEGFNFVKYCNPDVDMLLDRALRVTDQSRRREIYADVQNALLPDIPIAVLDFPHGITGYNDRLHNVFPSNVNSKFNTETWWIKT